MKKIIIFLFIQITIIQAFSQDSFTFEHDGILRDYLLYLPEALPENAPLVFVLHGYTSNATNIMTYSGMNAVANEHQFAVCYPQGEPDDLNTTHWNARLSISEIDDIGFLTALARFLQEEHNLDPLRTFSCGMSNGGFMSYTLACEKPETFKAIASVTGIMSGYTWENRSIAQPIPILHIHGTADNVVPIDGSMTTYGGWGGAPALDDIIDFWVEKNACATADSSSTSDRTTFYRYSNGIHGNNVWYYKIEDWSHEWPGSWAQSQTGIDAAEIIWNFFSRVNTTTSLPALAQKEIQLFPNPAHAYIELHQTNAAIISYQMYNLSGQLIMDGKINTESSSINIEHLEPGMYLLKTKNTSKSFLKID